MGSWIVANMPAGRLEDRVGHFRHVFSVAGVPALHTEVHSVSDDVHVLLWAWAKSPVPDVVFVQNERRDTALVLCGAVTGFGRYGAVPATLEEVAAELLNLYAQHGTALLSELNGSFSLAFVDVPRDGVTLCTDRFASRSVWFTHGKTARLAGNFPSALAALRPESPALDPAGLWSLFSSGRHVGRRGLYAGIENLQAGEQVVLCQSTDARTTSWYRLRYKPERGPSLREWSAQVAERLRVSADRLAAITPHPYLFLSGGLDSRLAAGALGSRTHTLTLASGQNMTARVASNVARRVGAPHQTLDRAPYWYLDTYEAASLAAGGNYNIKHAHFMAPVQQIRANNASAAFLLGDLLENFNKNYFKPVPCARNGFDPTQIPDCFHELYSYAHKQPGALKRLFRPEVAARIEESWRAEMVRLCEDVREVSDDPRDCFNALFRWYNCSLCPTYLMIECITPLASERNLMFDNDLYDLYCRMPADVRGSERTHPWTLWNLDRRLALMPDANAWQPPLTPKFMKTMAKKVRPVIGRARRRLMSRRAGQPATRTEGSWQLLQVFYRNDPKYKTFIEACLLDERSLPPDIFDPAAIKECWERFLRADTADTYEIDMLLSFGLLHRRLPFAGLH